MKSNYLFPNRFKKIGWLFFVPGIILGFMYLFSNKLDLFDIKVFAIVDESNWFTVIGDNVQDEISSILLIIGAILIAFSKEKSEDEFIAKIRLDSLVWATYINFAILLLGIIFTYGTFFLWVMIFNMFTLLVIFLVRFNWLLYNSKKQISDEE